MQEFRDSKKNEQVTKVSSPGISQTSADLQQTSTDGTVSVTARDYSHLWEPLYNNPWLKNHAFNRQLKKNADKKKLAQIFNKNFSSPTLIGIFTILLLSGIFDNPSHKLFEPCSTPHNSSIFEARNF